MTAFLTDVFAIAAVCSGTVAVMLAIIWVFERAVGVDLDADRRRDRAAARRRQAMERDAERARLLDAVQEQRAREDAAYLDALARLGDKGRSKRAARWSGR